MATVFDVAAYILKQQLHNRFDYMTTWKLQKLVYYAQAWSTVWDDQALFNEKIEAWANGPVCPALYDRHRGQFKISNNYLDGVGNPDALTANQRDTIDTVLGYYGDKSAQYLSELTHIEEPWIQARKGLGQGDRGGSEITLESMAEFYGGLLNNDVNTN